MTEQEVRLPVSRETEQQALWFRREAEAELSARIFLHTTELVDLQSRLRDMQEMTLPDTIARYLAADPEEVDHFRQKAEEYRLNIEDLWIAGERNLKPRSETETPQPQEDLLLLSQEEQTAKEQAIEAANELIGSAEENQTLLSQYYEQTLEQKPAMSKGDAWGEATRLLVEQREQEGQGLPDTNRLDAAMRGEDLEEYDQRVKELKEREYQLECASICAWNDGPTEDIGKFDTELGQVQKEIADLEGKRKRLDMNEQDRQPVEQQTLEDQQLPARERLTREQVESALSTGQHLIYKDLSGLDLSGLQFKGIDCSGTNFQNTTMRNTTFEACRMLHADFSGSTLDNCQMQGVNFRNSTWKNVTLHNPQMDNCSFRDARLEHVVLAGTIQEQERWHEKLKGLPQAFANSVYRAWDHVEDTARNLWNRTTTPVSQAWDSTKAGVVNLAEQIQTAALSDTVKPKQKTGAVLKNCTFEGATLEDVRFEQVSFVNTKFDKAHLHNVLFSGQGQEREVELEQKAVRAWADAFYGIGYFDPNLTAEQRRGLEDQLRQTVAELRDVPDYRNAPEHDLYSAAARHIQEINSLGAPPQTQDQKQAIAPVTQDISLQPGLDTVQTIKEPEQSRQPELTPNRQRGRR